MRSAREGTRWRRTLAVLAAGAVAAGVASAAYAADTLRGVESDMVAARFALRETPRPSEIVVVAIDGPTFSELALRWPFPRSLHAEAIDQLDAAGAREIVYDIQFTEPSTDPADDLALYDALERAGGAVLATTETNGSGATNVLGGDENLARIGAVAAASNFESERGGVIRRFRHSVGGLETLAVVTAERIRGRPVSPDAFAAQGALIDYRGAPRTFDTVSFADVVRGRVDRKRLRDKIVVVGASAASLQDVHPTPTTRNELMAGAEVQANAIWTALHGMPLRDAGRAVDLLAILLLAFLAPLASLVLRAPGAALTAVAGALVYALAVKAAFDAGSLVPVAYPLMGMVLGTGGMVAASYVSERRERERVSRYNEILEERVDQRTQQLRETQLEVIQRLAQAAESRDDVTGRHIERIGRMCERLGAAIGMSRSEAEDLRHASSLHDIGKIAIPDRVLMKPGKLDAAEWKVMKEHTRLGASMLAGSSSRLVVTAEQIALTHHERWDGSGYPHGLQGEQIPLAGRICAICDVFDALLSKRCYKEGWSLEAAVAEIRSQSARHFDPALVEPFVALAPELHRELHQLNSGSPVV
jgi:CHASE2 domain-containing sensor protein